MNRNNKNSEPLRVQNQKFKELRSLNESLRHRVQLLDLKAAVLGGAYVIVIFQALLYGQLNPSAAADWRQSLLLPACLSASVSAAFWPAFIDTINDCMSTRQQQESCFAEQDKVYRKICSVRRGGGDGAGGGVDTISFVSERRRRQAYVWVLYLALLLCTMSVPCLFLSLPNKREFQLSASSDDIIKRE